VRPVNLIPPEERRGERAPSRTGPLPLVVVGTLAVVLLAVTVIVMTGNQVTDRKADLVALEAREAAAGTQADALRPYADFATLAAAREATVTSLAQSRFDWERVLRELALVIPSDVWLVGITADAGGGATATAATGIAGPSLLLSGCGASHEAVAAFVVALEDVDGVTRVGIGSSERAETSSAGAAASGTDGGSDCRTRDFIAKFEITVAFDGVPAPASAVPAVPVVPPTAPATAPAPAPGEAPTATAAAADATQSPAAEDDSRRGNAGGSPAAAVPGVVR